MEPFSSILSIISLIISIAALYFNHKSNKINQNSFLISRDGYRASSIALEFICSKQYDGYYILKFVVFNPSSIATIIKSFSVLERTYCNNRFLEFFGMENWERIGSAKWCPSNEEVCNEIGNMEQNYKHLFVSDHKNIFVSIPGRITRDKLKFVIKTNNGGIALQTSIDATATHFSFDFHQTFRSE
ncbi:hypothetical protein ACSZOA_05195 [Aeromonas caviae]